MQEAVFVGPAGPQLISDAELDAYLNTEENHAESPSNECDHAKDASHATNATNPQAGEHHSIKETEAADDDYEVDFEHEHSERGEHRAETEGQTCCEIQLKCGKPGLDSEHSHHDHEKETSADESCSPSSCPASAGVSHWPGGLQLKSRQQTSADSTGTTATGAAGMSAAQHIIDAAVLAAAPHVMARTAGHEESAVPRPGVSELQSPCDRGAAAAAAQVAAVDKLLAGLDMLEQEGHEEELVAQDSSSSSSSSNDNVAAAELQQTDTPAVLPAPQNIICHDPPANAAWLDAPKCETSRPQSAAVSAPVRHVQPQLNTATPDCAWPSLSPETVPEAESEPALLQVLPLKAWSGAPGLARSPWTCTAASSVSVAASGFCPACHPVCPLVMAAAIPVPPVACKPAACSPRVRSVR